MNSSMTRTGKKLDPILNLRLQLVKGFDNLFSTRGGHMAIGQILSDEKLTNLLIEITTAFLISPELSLEELPELLRLVNM